ncbi:hypothetical protein [Nocardia africana]
MDTAAALVLLQLDGDLELPRRVVDLIVDPLLVADVRGEFDESLRWFIHRLSAPGEAPVTLNDVIKLGFCIWDRMPAGLVEGNPTAADAVEGYLGHLLEVVRGIVIDAAPTEA